MRDIALVPQRDVLVRRQRVGAHDARQAREVLAQDRVALVRHRGRALLPLAERLLRLAHLGALQMADLYRKLLERRGDAREHAEEMRVTIALNDLRRDRSRLQVHAPADVALDRGRYVRERPDRAGDLAHANLIDGTGKALQLAIEFGVEVRELQSERDRLGVDAVRAADHRRVLVLLGLFLERLEQAFEPRNDELARIDELRREGRVQQVR